MKLALNKNSLKQQRDHLAMYRRFLPSLDLKRQQLLAAWKEARGVLADLETEIDEFQVSLQRMLPLLGSSTLRDRDLSPLVRVEEFSIDTENVVGAKVPRVKTLRFDRAAYSTLTLPFWVDQLVDALQRSAELRVHRQVAMERVELLGAAARKITQRVNLFEKVLIPGAKENIRRIQIALSDEERAAVVRSKIAKKKNKQ